MKGISTIIAIVLIVMIVVALAALTWTWFTTIFSSLTSGAESAIEETTISMGTEFVIGSAKYSTLSDKINATIVNTGTQNFNISKSTAYINDEYSSIGGFDPSGIITPGDTSTVYNIANNTEACGKILKIIIETGLAKTYSISC